MRSLNMRQPKDQILQACLVAVSADTPPVCHAIPEVEFSADSMSSVLPLIDDGDSYKPCLLAKEGSAYCTRA